MNGYEAKSEMLIAAIKAIHRKMTDKEFVKSYQSDYNYDERAAESALMGICTELTYQLWVDWIAIQGRLNKG